MNRAILTDKEIKRIEILNRKKKHLNDSKNCLLETLKPIISELEKIRIEIDEIELKSR